MLFTLAPFYYMLVVSIKDQQLEVNLPQGFRSGHFTRTWTSTSTCSRATRIPRWALNTMIVACLSTLVALVFGVWPAMRWRVCASAVRR